MQMSIVHMFRHTDSQSLQICFIHKLQICKSKSTFIESEFTSSTKGNNAVVIIIIF